MQVKKLIAGMAMVLALAGCAGMPGSVQTLQSDFDGSIEVSVVPSGIPSKGSLLNSMALGAFWTNRVPDTVILRAEALQSIVNIDSTEGLQFNIEGEITKLSSEDAITETKIERISGAIWKKSIKRFVAPISFVEKLAQAEDVKVKLLVGQAGYLEGYIANEPSTPYQGLRDFLKEVHKHTER